MTKREDGTIRLGPVETWFCGAVGAMLVATFSAGATFAWSANAQIAVTNQRLGQLVELLQDHEIRLRDLERGP